MSCNVFTRPADGSPVLPRFLASCLKFTRPAEDTAVLQLVFGSLLSRATISTRREGSTGSRTGKNIRREASPDSRTGKLTEGNRFFVAGSRKSEQETTLSYRTRLFNRLKGTDAAGSNHPVNNSLRIGNAGFK